MVVLYERLERAEELERVCKILNMHLQRMLAKQSKETSLSKFNSEIEVIRRQIRDID